MLDKIPAPLRLGLLAAVAAALGLAIGLVVMQGKAVSIASGTLLTPPRTLPAFALTGIDGKPFTNADLQGRWTVVFAGFTTCPDICPTTLTMMQGVMSDLGPAADRLRMLLVSIDPERDTPERLKTYLQYFDPRFIGATGPNAALDQLTAPLGLAYVKVPGASPETYTMDHSAALVLIDPQGRFAGVFTAPQKRETLAADLKTILGKS